MSPSVGPSTGPLSLVLPCILLDALSPTSTYRARRSSRRVQRVLVVEDVPHRGELRDRMGLVQRRAIVPDDVEATI